VRSVKNERGQIEQIYVEIKCLAPDSTRDKLYIALGQYAMYAELLIAKDIASPLYLAIPEIAFQNLFDHILEQTFKRLRVKIVLIDLENEVVKEWKTF
jgi:hypothetical protein